MSGHGENAERVVLLDEGGEPIGTALKSEVHHENTPLHLAFSCYLFDGAGRFLLTQRALSKKTWPGVWTNSCCGHPGPGEDMEQAITRRMEQELGTTVTDLRVVVPDFRYRAVMEDGTVTLRYDGGVIVLIHHDGHDTAEYTVHSHQCG